MFSLAALRNIRSIQRRVVSVFTVAVTSHLCASLFRVSYRYAQNRTAKNRILQLKIYANPDHGNDPLRHAYIKMRFINEFSGLRCTKTC